MRKWFYAGAVAGGFLLLGAAPAHADVVPGPAGGLLGSLDGGQGPGDEPRLGLDPAGGLNLASPLGGSPLMDVQPGHNSADVTGPAADLLPKHDDEPAREADEPGGRKPARGSAPADLPLIGGLTGGGSSRGGLGGGGLGGGGLAGGGAGRPGGGLGNLIPANLLGGGLLGGGLTPDGRMASAAAPRESALFDGGVPLLGGLGGLLPANEVPRTPPADDDTPTGMPAGGTPVDPALVDPAPADPALVDPADPQAGNGKGKGKNGKSGKGQSVDDPRLHEEPTDDEAGGKKRTFSTGGRPIAGEDQDFK